MERLYDLRFPEMDGSGKRRSSPLRLDTSKLLAVVLPYLQEQGYRFLRTADSNKYMIDPSGMVLALDNSEPFRLWISEHCGVSVEDQTHKQIRAGMVDHVAIHGEAATIAPAQYLDEESGSFYLRADDHAVICASENGIRRVPHGTDNIICVHRQRLWKTYIWMKR